MPPFDAEQGFGHDKAAFIPCHNLLPDRRCRIHDTLNESGYVGCVAFECFGAGQRTTEFLKLEDSWHQQEASRAEVYDSFTRIRNLHELMALTTKGLELVTDQNARNQLISQLESLDRVSNLELAAMQAKQLVGIRANITQILLKYAQKQEIA